MTYVGAAPVASYVPPEDPPPPPPPPDPPDDIEILSAYYISASGSDSNDGTITNPFATLSHFLALPPDPGTALIYRGGTPISGSGNRSISITNGLSGEAGAPITLMAHPGESPQIDCDGNGFFISSSLPASHWRFSGIELLDTTQVDNGVLTWSATSGLYDDITIYGMTFHKVLPGANNTPIVYFGSKGGDKLVEQCRFFGVGYSGNLNIDGPAIQTEHAEQGGGLVTIRYNVFDNVLKGIQIYGDDADARARIEHNTFVGCGSNIEVVHYATATVRNNAGNTAEAGSGNNLYDSGEGVLTADHNYWAQTFSGAYVLLPGNTGINAATDGLDAGAIDSGT